MSNINNKILLNKTLEWYKENLVPVRFSKKLFDRLFEKFPYYSMTETMYCCHGLEQLCWQEVYEEGNWNLTLQDVKDDIQRYVNRVSKYLYNYKKNGCRFYMYEDQQKCRIFIYTRDKVKSDYHIEFYSKEI
jgi:hypothetical protein